MSTEPTIGEMAAAVHAAVGTAEDFVRDYAGSLPAVSQHWAEHVSILRAAAAMLERAEKMREALEKIGSMDPQEWGKQGIWLAHQIARDALPPAPDGQSGERLE